MASPDVIKKLEEGYTKLQSATDCKSLLKKYLTRPVLDECKEKKTKLGATLLDVIQSGVANLDSGVGVYAPDAEAYTLLSRSSTQLFRIITSDSDRAKSSRPRIWAKARPTCCRTWTRPGSI